MTTLPAKSTSDTALPRWAAFSMLVGSMALWGGTWPVGRVVAQSIEAWEAAFLRFALATAVLIPLCRLAGGPGSLRVRSGLLPRLVVLAATGVMGYSFLFFMGLQRISASRAALIVACTPACIALGTALCNRRLPRGLACVGIGMSLVGVSVVIADGNPLHLLSGPVETGDLMILGCVLCWTVYTLVGKPLMQECPPLVAVTWSCLLGSLMLLPPALYSGLGKAVTGAGGNQWMAIGYLGVAATALAYYWYNKAVHRVGTVASAGFINLVPLFAIILGFLLLDERLGMVQIGGGCLVIAGVLTTAFASRPQDGAGRKPVPA